ncbi:MAG: metallophosphoesterase [Planctomycetes bacterium]|nr:metallophosphoesterase [Planctomycetota bacterium]
MPDFDGIIFSDLHLSGETAGLNALFDKFVERVEGTPEIACLGDLTEYWIGHKHLRSEFGRYLSDQMERLAKPARRAIWVNGNRDFRFAERARHIGYKAFRNRYEGEFAGVQADLEHGDLLCTQDRAYQRFRLWFRNFPWWAFDWVTTADQAHRLCLYMRSKSKGDEARNDPEHFGIQPEPVKQRVARGAKAIVAGHVHTPFSRDFVAGERVGRLFVTSDWRMNGAVVCVVKDGEFKLMHFDGEDFAPFEAPEKQGIYSLEMAR